MRINRSSFQKFSLFSFQYLLLLGRFFSGEEVGLFSIGDVFVGGEGFGLEVNVFSVSHFEAGFVFVR